jgi:EAL domain-containing protein (putative c-di-GMP-specific phosphodiesterase class I)/GGDEF domain-containing protein
MPTATHARLPLHDELLGNAPVRALLETGGLRMVFQPIVALRDASVFAHEALVRGPRESPLEFPDALFPAARAEGLKTQFEFACLRAAIGQWGALRGAGKLFVNLNAGAMLEALACGELESALARLAAHGITAHSLVLELTEHERLTDLPTLKQLIDLFRLQGVQFALDDFGDGRSSLRLWSELCPDYVKIDKYFCRDLAQDATRLQTLRALMQIAETLGSELIAEGIECSADLRVVRDLGIRFGQGYLLGRPADKPLVAIVGEPSEVMLSPYISVMPEMRLAAGRRINAAQLLVQAPSVPPATMHDELFEIFEQDESLHAVAVVQDQVPVALIDRQQFIARYARPYFRELHGRRSCTAFANHEPLLIELHAGVEQLAELLMGGDQRYLREGFIIIEDGQYRGLGTGESLVRAVTEVRIEAARYANPLTLLPGNIPLSRHLDRLLATGVPFALAYADLDTFKPYNDRYGHWRGDEMIRLAAKIVCEQAVVHRDFVGHIGGDDFLVVFQGQDWRERCEAICRAFNARAPLLYDAEARQEGGIRGLDRAEQPAFFPFTTVSIGVALVGEDSRASAEEVSATAAAAKRVAKRDRCGVSTVPVAD